ncbi:hypothetical protein [Blastococcus sp. SYSU DS0617]
MLTTQGGAGRKALPRSSGAAVQGMSLVYHWGGPRHGEVDEVPAELLMSALLVYDGPRWFGVYERFEPVRVQDTTQGTAEVWVVLE